jgi:hypothetical protein
MLWVAYHDGPRQETGSSATRESAGTPHGLRKSYWKSLRQKLAMVKKKHHGVVLQICLQIHCGMKNHIKSYLVGGLDDFLFFHWE